MSRVREVASQLKQDLKAAPFHVKVVATIALIYLLSPFDLIPDFIPVIGQLDDLLLIGWLVNYVRKHTHDAAL